MYVVFALEHSTNAIEMNFGFLFPQIKMCNAVINSPVGGPDTTYKFTAGLVMSIPLDAEISHLNSIKPLRLRLKYPDQQTHLIVPRYDHLRPSQFSSVKGNEEGGGRGRKMFRRIFSRGSLCALILSCEINSYLLCLFDRHEHVQTRDDSFNIASGMVGSVLRRAESRFGFDRYGRRHKSFAAATESVVRYQFVQAG
jgi:hypothetical protein